MVKIRHICSICLKVDMTSLAKIQYLQNEQSEKEHIAKKASCFKSLICRDSSGEQNEFNRLPLRKNCPYSELFWSAFFPYFPTFGLVSLRIQSECGKIREKYGPE